MNVENISKKDIASMVSSCVANFLMFFSFYMLLPVTVAYLRTQLGASFLEVGLILSSNMLTAIAIRPFAGYILGRFNRRSVLIFAYIGFALCFLGYLIAPTLGVFTIFRLFHGLFFSLTTVTLNTMTIDAMPSFKRGKWLDYFSVMSNTAMAVGPMITLYLFDRHNDFSELFLIAITTSLCGILVSLFIRNAWYNRNKNTGYIAPKFELSLDRFILKKGLMLVPVIIIVSLSYGMLNTYTASYGNTVSGAVSGAGVFFLYFAISMVVSRIMTARFLENGHVKVLTNSSLIILIISFGLYVLNTNPMTYYISAIFMGLMYGVLAPVLQTMLVNMSHHDRRVTANATYLVSWDFGVGLGILFGGYIAQYEGLLRSFEFSTILLVLAFVIFVFFSSPYYKKNRVYLN